MSKLTCYDSDGNLLKELYQWDTGQTVTISGLSTPPYPVFHFCNRNSLTAKVVTPEITLSGLKAKIPNCLLEQAEPLIIYVYSDTEELGYRTLHAISIPVNPRPQPEDYECEDNIGHVSVALLSSRLSQLLAYLTDQSDGSVSPEIIDARIGYDGTVYDSVGDAIRAIGDEISVMSSELERYIDARVVDGLYYEGNKLYLTSNGEIVSDPVEIISGGGGGGGGGGSSASYIITLTNLLDSRAITVAPGQSANIRFSYASVDNEGFDDGSGVGSVIADGVTVSTFSVAQGNNSIDVAEYLKYGVNNIKIRVENTDGSYKTIAYTVTLVALEMSTTNDEFAVVSGDTVFYYTPKGDGTKTIHFLMDGTELSTASVASSGRSQRYTIPAQTHGAHIFSAYASVTVNGVTVESNTITIGLAYVTPGTQTPIIVTTFDRTTSVQGEALSLKYLVYNPASETTQITLSIYDSNNTTYSTKTITVDRTEHEWIEQNYPTGNVTFEIATTGAYVRKTVAVSESSTQIDTITTGLLLDFNPYGRSNNEANPESWSQGNISATFNGIGFAAADGWLPDADGCTMLRILPGGQMTIPYKMFETDKRSTGATVEVEMSTHNVRDYDTVVMSCESNGIGFKIASQYAELDSEQSHVSMQFKEDERVRISFVVEAQNEHRLIYVYVDGVMCGAIQYPSDDNFQQSPPLGITIGANSSGIDIYRILMYDHSLSRNEIVDNYIADRATFAEKMNKYLENDILDVSENIVIGKLPALLPYMIISCPELPQYKGDKKTCSITFVNPADTSKSFTATGVQIDVQGTSSAGYKKKNFKEKFNSGVTMTATGETASKIVIRDGAIPVKTICLKADVASSEGANNVELVRLYNDVCPYKTPPQVEDSRVRVGIDGFPIVVFWNNTDTNETKFWGKYNFNNDKGTEAVYGLSSGCESWEIRNNTSNRVIFKTSDYSTDDWLNDFEARYPEDNTDYTNLKRMTDWVVSTDRDAATENALSESVTYDGVTYSTDTSAYRLAKFKAEFEDYFVKAPMLFYYIFTEVFLMVDSRAKNMFPTTYDGVHWLPLPYDFDTALGINNEGQLVFEYDLEDTDTVNGANVFNGQDSVLWNNVRDAFGSDIMSMYKTLRSGLLFNYAEVVRRFADHQAIWCERVWNEDGFEKYIEPLISDNDSSYLTMLQGNKASQREWWLFNGFRYRDSKYQAGDANTQFITLRCYAVGDITVTPYSHIHPRIKYGSYTVTERGKRNTPTLLECPLDTMDDTEVYIYSADRLAGIGDLSPLNVGYADFSMATKLQSLKLGDSVNENTHLKELYVGNNELLTSLDLRNCVNLGTESQKTIDLSGCVGLAEIYANGTQISGITLPVGGKVTTLYLPATLTNLTLRDLKELTTLSIAGYTNISTLRIENTPNVPVFDILSGSESLTRIRLVGISWNETSATTAAETFALFDSCGGLDAAGGNTLHAVISGSVHIGGSINISKLMEYQSTYPSLTITADTYVNDVLRDSDECPIFDSASKLILATGGGYDLRFTAAQIDEFISQVLEEGE